MKFRNIIILLACFLTLGYPIFGQSASTWKEAKSFSKETNKPILLNFKHQRCLPCKELYADVFKNHTLRSQIDKHFHVFIYDIDFETIRLENQYRVKGYPTTVIVDKDGKMLKKFSGYRDPFTYMQQLEGSFRKESIQKLNNYLIPSQFVNYKHDIKVHRELVQHIWNDPEYEVGEILDPLGIYEDYYNNEKNVDSFYIKLVAEKLAYLKAPRKWFLENAETLKKEFGITYLESHYYKVLKHDVPYPGYIKGTKSLLKRSKKIAARLTKFVDQNNEYRDSIYNIEAFYASRNLIVYNPELEQLKNNCILNLLKYQSKDEYLLKQLYEHCLDLCLDLKCTHDLAELIKIIEANPLYVQLPSFLEIQAIAYYRIQQEKIALAKITMANRIAREKNIYYSSRFSALVNKKLLKTAVHKCR